MAGSSSIRRENRSWSSGTPHGPSSFNSAKSDIDRYLEDRQKRGFNSIIVNLIEHKFCTTPPKTRAGLAPFTKAGDFSTPNPAYFDFAHKVVKKANDRGIVVWLFPAYLATAAATRDSFER